MSLVADILLVAGALVAALYCFILSRRLRRLGDLDQGLGGAISSLSHQVDDLTRVLDSTRRAAFDSSKELSKTAIRAERAAQRLELLLAALHEEPDSGTNAGPATPPVLKLRRQDRTGKQVQTGQDRSRKFLHRNATTHRENIKC